MIALEAHTNEETMGFAPRYWPKKDTLLSTQMFPHLAALAIFVADKIFCPGHKK